MKIRDFFKDKAWKKWDKSQWMILLLTGVLLMILAIPTGDRKKEEKPVDSTTEQGREYGNKRRLYEGTRRQVSSSSIKGGRGRKGRGDDHIRRFRGKCGGERCGAGKYRYDRTG